MLNKTHLKQFFVILSFMDVYWLASCGHGPEFSSEHMLKAFNTVCKVSKLSQQ